MKSREMVTREMYDYIVIGVFTLLSYSNIWIKHEYVFDEKRIVMENAATECTANILDLWQYDFWGWPLDSDGSHQSWRPLTSLTYKLEHCLLGKDKLFYRHLINVVLHLLVSFQLYHFTRKCIKDRHVRLLTTLLFALHPIQTEAVVSLYGRADLLSTFFMICALQYWEKNLTLYAVVTASLGLLAKETSIVVFPIFTIYSLLSFVNTTQPKLHLKKMFISLLSGFVLLLLRLSKSKFRKPTFSELDNSFQLLDQPQLALNLINLPVRILRLLFFPQTLCHDRSYGATEMDSFNSVKSWLQLGLTLYCIYHLVKFISDTITSECIHNGPVLQSKSKNSISTVSPDSYHPHGRISLLLSLLSFPAVSLIVRWLLLRYNYDIIIICNQKTKFISFDVTTNRGRKDVSDSQNTVFTRKCGLVLLFAGMLILYLPMSQLFTYVGFNVAERCIYPLALPFTIAIGLGFDQIKHRFKFIQTAFLITLFISALKTHNRVSNWQNDHELSINGAANGSIKSKVNLAVNLAAKHDFNAAKIILGNALKHTNHADIYYNLGYVSQLSNSPKDAIENYQLCLMKRPSHSTCRLNYADLLEKSGVSPEVELKLCLQLMSSKSTRGQIDARSCAFNLSRYYVKVGDVNRAYQTILPFAVKERKTPTSGYDTKLRASLFNLVADIQIRRGMYKDAEQWIQSSLMQYHHTPTFESRLRLCLLSDEYECEIETIIPLIYHHRLPQLLTEFHRSDKLRSFLCDSPSANGKALETCGLIARKQQNYKKAKMYFKKAIQYLPYNERFIVYANLGGVMHIEGEYENAIFYYSEALQIKPRDEVIEQNIVLLQNSL